MKALCPDAPAAIAVLLSVLKAGALVVQPRTGDFGWINAIWTFPLGLAEVQLNRHSAAGGAVQRSRGDRYRGCQSHQLPQDDPRKWRPVF